MEKGKDRRRGRRDFRPRRPEMNPEVRQAVERAMEQVADGFEPAVIEGMNAFQRKQIHRFLSREKEYDVKSYRRDEENTIMKIFPVGRLKRLAEQRAQEVLMSGESIELPPMGSYERFIVHSYLKDRGGVDTVSLGEGDERHIRITPVFGRTLKKAKRRLT